MSKRKPAQPLATLDHGQPMEVVLDLREITAGMKHRMDVLDEEAKVDDKSGTLHFTAANHAAYTSLAREHRAHLEFMLKIASTMKAPSMDPRFMQVISQALKNFPEARKAVEEALAREEMKEMEAGVT